MIGALTTAEATASMDALAEDLITAAKAKPETQTAKILRLLKQRKQVTNYELSRICFRYSARILELRNEGHIIVSVHDRGTKWRFVYKGHVDDPQEHMPS